MNCPGQDRLAAAAADEDPRAAAHAEACARCGELLADQRDLRALARTLPAPQLAPEQRALLAERIAREAAPITSAELAMVLGKLRPPVLDDERRASLAASVLAASDANDDEIVPIRHRGPRIAVVTTLAAAAAVALVFAWSATHRDRDRDSAPVASRHEPVPAPISILTHAPTIRTPQIAHAPSHVSTPNEDVHTQSPTPALAPTPTNSPSTLATILAAGADFTRTSDHDDVVQLRDGVLDVDARGRSPVAIAIGDTTFTVREAHVELVAANGVIVSAHSFAGSVERATGELHAVIADGDVWTPPAGPATSLASFRAGWQALRAGRYAPALASFELATDPVVAEDAAFWAAIAAQRLDDREGARRRFRAFIAAFPSSPRADSARRALEQLDK